ncbi:MAG: lysophospholipid acyltransferase family protein [Candidatus Tectimicrobiota bacterium]
MKRPWLWLVYTLTRAFFRLRCRLRIEGSEHIPAQGGVLIASNHLSAYDTFLLPYTILTSQGLQVIWSPAKAELFQRPWLAHFLTSVGAFPVRRGQHDRQAMRRILQHMRTDKIMLFPEGTRSPDGQLQAGKRTIGKLIYQARPVVVPAAVLGTEHILPHPAALLRGRVPVTVRYGKPLDLQSYYDMPDAKPTSEAIVQALMAAIAALLAAPPETGSSSRASAADRKQS